MRQVVFIHKDLAPVKESNPVLIRLLVFNTWSEKRIDVNPKTHLWISYWSEDVIEYAYIPVSSLRDLHQRGKRAHYSYLWKLPGRALPWCSAGAIQTQTMILPAAAWPGRACTSHQKATIRFPKHNTPNIILSGLVLIKCIQIVDVLMSFSTLLRGAAASHVSCPWNKWDPDHIWRFSVSLTFLIQTKAKHLGRTDDDYFQIKTM